MLNKNIIPLAFKDLSSVYALKCKWVVFHINYKNEKVFYKDK